MFRKILLGALAAAAMMPAGVTARTSVEWSTLGNTVDADGKPCYTQRFKVSGDTPFSKLAFNQFAARMVPVDPADKIEEILPGYYAIVSPRFQSTSDTVVVDIVTYRTLRNICYGPDGVHLVLDDATTAPVEMSWDNITRSKNLYSTPDQDKMPYGDAIYALNEQRNAAEAIGAYDIVPSFKQVRLTGGAPVPTTGCEVEIVAVENEQPDWMKLTVADGKIRVETNNESLATNRVAALLSRNATLPAAEITDWPDFPYRGLMVDIVRNYQTPAEMHRLVRLMSRYGLNVLHFHIADDEGWRLEIPGLPELTEVGGRRGYTLDSHDFIPQIYSGDGNPETTGNASNGYFTRDEFIALLREADALGIRVIPEIESPGHARAALYAMEKRYRDTGDDTYRMIDPDDKSVYTSAQDYHDNVMNLALPGPVRFMTKVGEEIQKMYAEAGVPLPAIHIGGDEVGKGAWTGSPIAREYMKKHGITNERDLHLVYVRELTKEYDKLGIPTSGWQEIAVGHSDDFNAEVRPYIYSVNCWSTIGHNGQITAKSAQAGYPTVLSNVDHFYMDLCYNYHPLERGLTWGGTVDEFVSLHGYPRELCKVSDEDFKNVIGVSGQLFAETMRSPEMIEYFLLPKMLGMAERAWNADTTYTDTRFNAVVNAEMPVWQAGDYNFHIAQPGIIVEGGKVLMNAPYPDAEIRYTTDGREPDATSALYTGPFATDSREIRAITVMPAYGKQSLTSILYIP